MSESAALITLFLLLAFLAAVNLLTLLAEALVWRRLHTLSRTILGGISPTRCRRASRSRSGDIDPSQTLSESWEGMPEESTRLQHRTREKF